MQRRDRLAAWAGSALVALATACVFVSAAQAQIPPPLELPGERPEELPIPTESDTAAPSLDRPAPEALPPSVAPELTVDVRAIRVTGNTVLSGDAIAEAVRPFTNRSLAAPDIEALAAAVTDLYVAAGYVTSGAVVPDQDFAGGVLTLQVIEGRIGALRVEGESRLRRSAIRRDVWPDERAPLDVNRLEERLRRLQQRPEVESVNAELRPGSVVGEATLIVRVEGAQPLRLAGELSNHRSPALGQVFGELRADVASPAGLGDDLGARAEFGAGLADVEGFYRIPVTRFGTAFAMRVRYSDSEVVEDAFAPLDIESDYLAAGLELTQPLWRRGAHDLSFGVRGEWRRSRSRLGGYGFSFSEGADAGTSVVSVLRTSVSWLRRSPGQVFAMRLQGSFGLPILGATDVAGRLEDATFASGLLQAQWARRFSSLRGAELIARGDLQLASQALLNIEQFSVGGHASVRGYRDNTLVRDNGYALSLEARVPLWRRPDGTSVLQLAPFFDVGRAWDKTERPLNRGDTLIGLGTGLRYRPFDWLDADLYWGYGFNDAFDRGSGSAQDVGLYFRLVARAF